MFALEPKKLSFSGHESFQCRSLWLKKGYDFVTAGNSFASEDAVVELGVGKNMVNAIRYWMKAFGLTNESDKPTPLAQKLLNDVDGWDSYLEDEGTLWLLHYQLATTARASTYGLIFNGLRRDKIEFTKSHFLNYAKRQAEIRGESVNENTIKSDFEVFVRMYLRPDAKDRDEGLVGLMTELNLIRVLRRPQREDHLVIENTGKSNLPDAILLYGILANRQFDLSVNFNTLLTEPDQVGSVFALNATGLYTKLERIVADKTNTAVFSDQAGIRELSFKSIPDSMTVLAKYYAR
ncbi:MAG: DUF4007 family protein [Rudanella sp.]|nr:DUF4007 family protein [Rudanella sp.]